MKILNIGSLNLDYVYQVDHIVAPGETEAGKTRSIFPGGKGLNQSVALARAGAEVYHCGLIGSDGQFLLEICRENGVKTEYIHTIDGPSGHAVIQVDRTAQNSILLFGGANRCFTEAVVDEALSGCGKGDVLLLQNEINLLPYIVDRASEKGLRVVLNPSPFDETLREVDLGKVGMFLLNEVEGEQLTGVAKPEEILRELRRRFPQADIVLTLGRDGACYAGREGNFYQPAFPVEAVDTTAAGDTFTGYFLAAVTEGKTIPEALRLGARASSAAVTKAGAIPSVPWRQQVEELEKNEKE